MTRRLLITADAVGGVWQYTIELARGLVRDGWGVDVALLGPAAARAQRVEASEAGVTLLETGLPLDWLAADARAVIAAADAVARLARERGADIVQLNQPALGVAPFSMPTVAVMHSCVASWWAAAGDGPLPADLRWQTDLVARGLARAGAVVAPSTAFAVTVSKLYPQAPIPLAIHNGRSLPPASGPMHDFAFTAGRLWDHGKNVATLDRAAARLGIPFKAAGATTGPHGEHVRVEHLHLLGQVSDQVIAGCLSARPVFASAAVYEPFGLAVLEAALAGCPLVLSDTPTFRELWEGVATFVPADDGVGFAAAIEELAGDVPLRTARGALARRRALTYTPERNRRAMATLYERLLGGHDRVAA
ncbi:glycosyltransferase family 4 protein [Sphingomonas sp. DT-51]|uniref:glycosyltransferase family 4 protein n=1 Tax=Sphingomonas sp. DT-51 TaxID=3396165 RepID=UPI003F1D90EA